MTAHLNVLKCRGSALDHRFTYRDRSFRACELSSKPPKAPRVIREKRLQRLLVTNGALWGQVVEGCPRRLTRLLCSAHFAERLFESLKGNRRKLSASATRRLSGERKNSLVHRIIEVAA